MFLYIRDKQVDEKFVNQRRLHALFRLKVFTLIAVVAVIMTLIYNSTQSHKLMQIMIEWVPIISVFLLLICVASFKVSICDYMALLCTLTRVVTVFAKFKLKADGYESFQFDPKGELKTMYFLNCEALFLLQVNWKTDLLTTIPLLAVNNSIIVSFAYTETDKNMECF